MNDDHNTIARIRRAIGKKVTFQYPGNEKHKHGILKDRIIIPSNPGTSGVPYWDVVDLISFSNEIESEWIRIGYYRKPNNRLVWGSQTTITEPISTWKRIFIKAAQERKWFRELIQDIAQELQLP